MQIFNLLFQMGSTIMSDNQIAHSTNSMNSINNQKFVKVLLDHNYIIGVHLNFFWWTKGIIISNSILCSTMLGVIFQNSM
jgi:hypothetical protein